MSKTYWVYIMSNKINTVLYTGVTDNLSLRVRQHKEGTNEGFTKRYHVNKLVWFEEFQNPIDAIISEKKIKGWTRWKKVQLIQNKNSIWKDLSLE